MHRHDVLDEHLGRVPLFVGLSKKQLRLVSQLARQLKQPAGTVLIEQGEVGHEFIVVVQGQLEVSRGGRVVGEHGPGSYVGEIALLERRPRTATVIAKTPVKLEVINQREFAGLLEEMPELAQQVRAVAADRLADAED
jgi:CRP/FNR family cyclic AMP-dependent transcriptional regulator